MRIGYVHSRAFPSVEANVVQVVQMCRAFSALGHDITLFIPRAAECSDDAAALAQAQDCFGGRLGFRVVFVSRRKILGRLEVLGSVRGTLRALRAHPQDLIYSRNPWSVYFLSRQPVPFIWEAHEARVHKTSVWLSRLLRGRIVRAANGTKLLKVVAISDALARVWERYGVPPEKLLAAHDGVDLALFSEPLSRAAARSELELPPERKLVVYTGALKSDRGPAMMLECARRIPEAEFCFVGGTAAELAHWTSEARRLKLANVRFPGRVAHREIPRWLAAADVLLMMWTWQVPTIRVCSPMKLFEYMAARRLIVGPAFPTVLEVLEPDVDALLFTPDDVSDMERALRAGLLRSEEPDLPARALQKVRSDYTWAARCAKILEAVAADPAARQGQTT